MASRSGQKFIGRNRAPRVQIEYDVEIGNAQKKVQLPFVMGVLADLSGKSNADLPGVDDREFLNIDVDNFDSRLKAMKPRVSFTVPNMLTGEGQLGVDITFENMDDFTPAAIAQKVEGLNRLFEARRQLAALAARIDGKKKAQDFIAELLSNPTLLQALASAPKDKPAGGATEESSNG